MTIQTTTAAKNILTRHTQKPPNVNLEYGDLSPHSKLGSGGFCVWIPILIGLLMLMGCSSGSTLRSARVLDKGQFEVSAGAVVTQFLKPSQVVIGAYGVTENVELEARWEDDYVAITPRLQLLRSETSIADCLTFFELGYGKEHHLQWGPGILIGKRWNNLEPYSSYRFRYEGFAIHYVKFGGRIYFPFPCNQSEENLSSWFIGVEMGPSMSSEGTLFEWAANIGFQY